MKKVILLLLLFYCTTHVKSQLSPERVYEQYQSAKTSDDKTSVINNYFKNLAEGTFTFADRITNLIKMQEYFKNKGDVLGTGTFQIGIAGLYKLNGEYLSSLKYSLPALKNIEELNDTDLIIHTLVQIGSSFTESQNFQQGLNYYNKCRVIIEAQGNPNKEMYAGVLTNIADCYNKLNLPDSALPNMMHYAAIAEELQDSSLLVNYYCKIGESYLKKDNPDSARLFFWKSINYANHPRSLYSAQINNDFAESLYKSTLYDSALNFAKHAVYYADPEYKKELMIAYKWLYKIYEIKNDPDNVNKYYRLSMDIKDSLFTSEKNSNIVLMDFQEQERQDKIEAERIKNAAERMENIEYALISLGIALTAGLFLLLNRRFSINIRVIKTFGVVILLIVFEFFNLLFHPFLEHITHHSPVLMLAALVLLAAILAPLHHKAEKWAMAKLLEKNKAVGIASFNKIIEQGESKNE